MAYSRPEPLSRQHELDAFNSGEPSLDQWLIRYARHAEAADSARVFVTSNTTAKTERVVGYYALTIGNVSAADATERLTKGQPAHATIPVALLARFAVDIEHQGRGIGQSLLQDVLLRFDQASDQIGMRAICAHAINEDAASFYHRFGFAPSPTDPLHMILLAKDLRKLLSE